MSLLLLLNLLGLGVQLSSLRINLLLNDLLEFWILCLSDDVSILIDGLDGSDNGPLLVCGLIDWLELLSDLFLIDVHEIRSLRLIRAIGSDSVDDVIRGIDDLLRFIKTLFDGATSHVSDNICLRRIDNVVN